MKRLINLFSVSNLRIQRPRPIGLISVFDCFLKKMMSSNYFIFVRDWLEFGIGSLSLICSLLTLLIIYEMKIWNGNLLLITTLTIFQISYDINFLLGVCPGYIPCVIWHALDIFGGLAVAFATNVISYTIYYVVTEIESVNVRRNYYYFMIFMFGVPLIFGITVMFTLKTANADDDKPFTECVYNSSILADVVENFYYWSRIVSIVVNLLAFGYVSVRVSELGFVAKQNTEMSTTVDEAMTLFEKKSLAVKALASRMKYYPLAQAITRAGSAWNEFQNYEYSNDASTIMSAVCASFSGTAYFLVFLVRRRNIFHNILSHSLS
jgi:hypothetical protein